ncbi:MAG: outer membrane beta-barrel protein [Clostridiales bacterium]|nr:outer membrane beta-barrel protein [Clostridiales bacterium]
MSKRFIYFLMTFMIIAPGVGEAGFLNRFGLSLNPGTVLALHGNYSDSKKLKDMVIPGAGLGLIIRYKIRQNLFLDAGYSYNWLFIKQEKRPSAYETDKPAFVLPMYTLNGTFFLVSGHSLEPYVTLGAGLYPWRFSSEAIRGEIWPAPENTEKEFSKSSLGVNGGLGVEVRLWSKLAVFAEATYLYLFAKDEEKFGTGDFANQGFLGIRLGMTLYFGQKESSPDDEGQRR